MKKISEYIKKIVNINVFGFIGGLLGAYAGSEGTSKNWRRIVLPALITLVAYYYLRNLWVLTIILQTIGYRIGYGTPCWNDKGSFLGRLFYEVFKLYSITKRRLYTNMATRGAVGILISLSLISIPLIKHNWLVYVIGSLAIITVYSLISWRDLGVKTIKIRGKNVDLLWSDLYTYFTVTSASIVIIKF